MCVMTHSYVWHGAFRWETMTTSISISSVLQCVAVCCSVLQCVAVCCSVLQCDAVWHGALRWETKALFTCVTWLILMCDMTHLYVCHDSFICVPWLIHICVMTHSYVWHGAFRCETMALFTCVTWLIHICAMTHSWVCHDSVLCVPWLISTCESDMTDGAQDMCVMPDLYVCHDSFLCVQWLISMCAMTHFYVRVRHDWWRTRHVWRVVWVHIHIHIHDWSLTGGKVAKLTHIWFTLSTATTLQQYYNDTATILQRIWFTLSKYSNILCRLRHFNSIVPILPGTTDCRRSQCTATTLQQYYNDTATILQRRKPL